MAHNVLQELSKQTINITKFEEAALSWHETYLTVLSEKGVHIFELAQNIQCLDKKIDFIQSFISHPRSSPAASLFTERVLNKDLKNIHLTEMIVDHALWPHNSQLLHEMSTIVDFKWSPVGTIKNYHSAIAVLTNVGVVEIYIQHRFKWACALQISALLNKETLLNSDKPTTFVSLKEMAYSLASTAMCWSSTLNDDNSCYLITAQKNGNIVLWLVKHEEANVVAKLVSLFQSNTCEIVCMRWIPVDDETVMLLCTNVLGQIIGYCCQFRNGSFKLLQSHTIWPHKDRMITKLLQHIKINDKIILTCNKHRHLIVIMLGKDCKILAEHINNINDYRITAITKAKDGIYITTVNCKIYKLNLTLVNDKLEMGLDLVEYHGLSSTHEMYSIGFSHNSTLCTISAVNRKVHCKKDPMMIEIILMSTRQKLDILLDTLFMNPTKRLTQYWDVIEVLRYRTMKTKEAPSIDYNQLYKTACSDIYTLKVYLLLSTLCDSLKKLFKLSSDFHLPEDSVEVVKEEILVAHADSLIRRYHKKIKMYGKLENLEIEYFLGAKKFLEYIFNKNKKNLFEVVQPEILCVVDRVCPYVCQCCDEEVAGFMCKNEHLNMFCALTFTPIHSNTYLTCKWCNLTARKELFSENPLCLFCDVNLTFVND